MLSKLGLNLLPVPRQGCIPMVKKSAIVVVVLYLLGVIGVTIGALSMNWNPEWPLQQQLGQAVGAGVSWPLSVVELFTPDSR